MSLMNFDKILKTRCLKKFSICFCTVGQYRHYVGQFWQKLYSHIKKCRFIYPYSSNKSRPRILTRDKLLPISFHRQVQHINYLNVLNSLCWSLHSKLSKKVWHLKIGPSVHKLWTFILLKILSASNKWRATYMKN